MVDYLGHCATNCDQKSHQAFKMQFCLLFPAGLFSGMLVCFLACYFVCWPAVLLAGMPCCMLANILTSDCNNTICNPAQATLTTRNRQRMSCDPLRYDGLASAPFDLPQSDTPVSSTTTQRMARGHSHTHVILGIAPSTQQPLTTRRILRGPGSDQLDFYLAESIA